MKCHLLVAGLLFCTFLSAQNYTHAWRNCFDDGERFAPRLALAASATDRDDNLYIAGFVNLNRDRVNDSIYLRKYNPAGTLLWELYEPFKSRDDPNNSLLANVVLATDRNGNVVLSYPYSFATPDVDAVVNKYSPAGNKLWQSVFDGPVDVDNAEVRKLITDREGNIYLLASRSFSYYHYADIVKFSSAGKQLWYQDMTGVYDFDGNDATLDSSGNVYITGSAYTSANYFYKAIITYKFFAGGKPAWAKRFTAYYNNNAFRVMYAKKDSSVVVCGHTAYSNSGDSIIAIKYTRDGSLLWSYRYKPAINQTFNQSLIDGDNNILIASSQTVGPNYTAPFLTKLSSSGAPLWSKFAFEGISIPEPYTAFDLETDAQNNYYTLINQPEGVRIQKFKKNGALLTQTRDGIDTSVSVTYAALHTGSRQSLYAVTSYFYYLARSSSCVSRYELKDTLPVSAGNKESNNLTSVKKETLLLYPNPAHNIIYVPAQNKKATTCMVLIFDALGKQVYTGQVLSPASGLDISALKQGLYVLKIPGT